MEIPVFSFEDLLSILTLIGSGYITLVLAQYWIGPKGKDIFQNIRSLDKFFICLIIGHVETIASLTILCTRCSTPFPSGIDDLIRNIRQNLLGIYVFNTPWIIIIALSIAAVLRSESLNSPWLPFDKEGIDIWLMIASLTMLAVGYGLFLWEYSIVNGFKILSLYLIFFGIMFLLKSLKRTKK